MSTSNTDDLHARLAAAGITIEDLAALGAAPKQINRTRTVATLMAELQRVRQATPQP